MSDSQTNTIIKELGTLTERIDQNHRAVIQELQEVKEKQDYTNGDVKELKNWRHEQVIKAEAFKEFEAKMAKLPVATTKEGNIVVASPPPSYWESKQRLYGALAALATAVAAVLGILYGVSK